MAAAARAEVAGIHHRPAADDAEALDRLFQRLRGNVIGADVVLCGGSEGEQQPGGGRHPPTSDRMLSIQPPDVEHMTLGSDISCSGE